jgi:maltooligosyltrehalose synthase
LEHENNLKNWNKKNKDINYVRFIKLQKLVNTNKEQLKEEFEKNKEDLKKRLLRRRKTELKKTFK